MLDKKLLDKVENTILNGYPEVLKTGFQDLDSIIGNVEKGSIITIGGRPSMGKTAFAISILLNLLEQNEKCLYFSLEMTENSLIRRVIFNYAEVNTNRAYQNCLTNKDISRIKISSEIISEFDLKIYAESLNFENIKKIIEEEKAEYIFIDYLQLINLTSKKTRSEVINKILLELKQLAKENNCVIFILSQLSRYLENRIDKRPMLCDLRDSGGIEEVSDVVLFIYREEYYHVLYDKDNLNYALNKGEAEIIVAKNKFGPVGIINLLYKSNFTKFYNPLEKEMI